MIRHRRAQLLGAGASLCLALACRDAPTAPAAGGPGPSFDVITDTVSSAPPLPEIIWAKTEIAWNDGRYGGGPAARITADMEYIGNRGSHNIHYSVVGDEPDIVGNLYDVQNRAYSPFARHRFTRPVTVATQKNCGLTIDAHSDHQAWWAVWFPVVPSWESTKATRVSTGPTVQSELCLAPEQTSSGGGGGSYLIITTCWYWATIVGGRVTAVELDYCESTVIPIDENTAVNQM